MPLCILPSKRGLLIKQIKEFTLDSIGEFLSQYAEKSESVFWLSSPDFERIVYISPAYETIWGRKATDLYTNPSSWLDALVLEPGEQYNPITAMAEKIAQHGSEARFEETYRIWRPDGEIRWIMDRGFPVYDKHGNCCGVTGVANDITQSKQVEDALKAAKSRAEFANKSKTDFLAKITHELRTPLNGILGNTELLEDAENITILQKDTLNSIETSGKHLLSLIDELLDIATLESGRIELEQKTFVLNDMLQNVYKQCSIIANKKGLPLYLDCNEKPQHVVGDEKRLKQIIINLVSNAAKFTHSGHIIIKLTLINTSDKKCTFQINVIDTGIGIADDKLDYIFEKFNQVDDGLAGRSDGFGLGLAISREIIEKMNGHIKVVSKVNHGTSFTIELTLPNITEQPNTENKEFLSRHILLIEDHPINQKVAVAMLQKLNCSVDCATDGNTALKMFKNNRYDLILTDISLPDIDGCEVTRRIRSENADIPIIAVTAHTNSATKRTVYESGANDLINKPIVQAVLKEKLLAWQ